MIGGWRLVTMRLPAFRFLHYFLIGRNGRNGRPKGRPHPCPFLEPNRFRASRDHVFASARFIRDRARKNSGAETRRENGGVCYESPQKLAQRTPSPQRGEGWGEGFGLPSMYSESVPPHPVLLPSGEKGRSVVAVTLLLSARRLSRARHNAPRDGGVLP